MLSPVQLDQDIWYLVLEILSAKRKYGNKDSRDAAKSCIASLRLTNRFLAVAAAPHLLFKIKVLKIDNANSERLKALLRSPTTCQVVKRYEFQPRIITSRQGDLSASPYHKIPPYLDYGRNSSSPIIQAENRHLRQSEAHFTQQYTIIFPTKNKAAAALKGAFKYSRTSREPGLKDSVYFTALEAFPNLESLVVAYPRPEESKLIKVVTSEYSIALGRYLAHVPQYLTNLEISSIPPGDLVTLANDPNAGANKYGSANFILNVTNFKISLKSILDYNKASLHRMVHVGTSLATLLELMPKLESLSVQYSVQTADKVATGFAHLALSPFRSPQLPSLRSLNLQGLALSSEELVSFVTSSPSRLTGLKLESIALVDSTWTSVLRTFSESETLEYFTDVYDIQSMCYRDMANPTWRVNGTQDDHKSQAAWEAKIEQRIGRSVKLVRSAPRAYVGWD